jgi:hypothetical protein
MRTLVPGLVLSAVGLALILSFVITDSVSAGVVGIASSVLGSALLNRGFKRKARELQSGKIGD